MAASQEEQAGGRVADESASPAEIVRRQTGLRELNERIEGIVDGLPPPQTDAIAIVCECGHDGCGEHVELSQSDYEQIRRHPTHFVVRPGHDNAAVERVVAEHGGYVVVEKFGEGGAAAVRLDPRRQGA